MTWVVVLGLAGVGYLLWRRPDRTTTVVPPSPRPMAVRFKTAPELPLVMPAGSAANLRVSSDEVKVVFFAPAEKIDRLPRHRTPAATIAPISSHEELVAEDEPDTIPISRDDGPFPGEFAHEDSPIPREPTVITSAPRYR